MRGGGGGFLSTNMYRISTEFIIMNKELMNVGRADLSYFDM